MSKVSYIIDYPTDMPNPLDTYLKMNGCTRYRLAKNSGVSTGTLQHVVRRKVENIEGKYYIYIGKLLGKDPSIVFKELLNVQKNLDDHLAKKE